MSSYAKIPYATLTSIGGTLTGVHDTLDSGDKGAHEVDGLSGDQSDINSAIGDFRGEWDASVKRIKENIGGLGGLSKDIGAGVGGFDADVAKSMTPEK